MTGAPAALTDGNEPSSRVSSNTNVANFITVSFSNELEFVCVRV
jgi:hypothetical protein